jgi:chromosomal replication initiator protein
MDILILGENGEADYSHREGDSPVTEEYTFERFVVGNTNRYAHAAAKAVAGGNVQNYNPLFIYGDSGLGKTHLLHAIRIEMKRRDPDCNVVLVTGEEFTNELIFALQIGKNIAFREKYRSADALLIDDIQFIAGKPSTQEEFFHTFNDLYDHGREIVLTSDRPPQEMSLLEERLRTRFESGVMTEINAPDYETRMAIIRNKASQLGMVLSNEVANYIAENLTFNVRQLEGAVKMIKARSEILGSDIDIPLAADAIKDLVREGYTPNPERIIEETAKYFNLTPEDIRGQSRTKNMALARQVAMYVIRRLTNLTLDDIGEIFDRRDHTTVLSSIRKIENSIQTSNDFSKTVKDIIANVNSGK